MKRMNKRGQEGLSTGTLVLLVIGIIVLIVVVAGFTLGWDYIFGKLGLLPGTLEAAAQSCGLAASSNLQTSYCNEFKKVDIAGEKQYMNCEDLEVYAVFEKLDIDCNTTLVDNLAGKFCVNEKLKDDDLVNGEACSALKLKLA